jgi:hypothetical protein
LRTLGPVIASSLAIPTRNLAISSLQNAVQGNQRAPNSVGHPNGFGSPKANPCAGLDFGNGIGLFRWAKDSRPTGSVPSWSPIHGPHHPDRMRQRHPVALRTARFCHLGSQLGWQNGMVNEFQN